MLAPHIARLADIFLSNLHYRFVDLLKITPVLGRARIEADTRRPRTFISVERTLMISFTKLYGLH